MNEELIPKGETLIGLSIYKPDYYIAFSDPYKKEIGRFFLKDDKIDFEGDITESAKMFVEELKRMWNK